MTENKAQKAAIRARMAATGEPYSAARHAVRGGQPPAPPGQPAPGEKPWDERIPGDKPWDERIPGDKPWDERIPGTSPGTSAFGAMSAGTSGTTRRARPPRASAPSG